MIKFKSQKGSITLFVLIAVLFFSVILFGMYNSNMNKLQTQDRDIARIKQEYEKEDVNQIIYEKNKIIAYYDAKNNTGKEYFDGTATTWKDLSGNNYDMTFNNINNTSTSGWVDNSMILDGIDDYLTINSNLDLSKYNDLTISATYKVLTNKGSATGLLCSSTPGAGRLFLGYGSANQYRSNFTMPDTWMWSESNTMVLGKTANVIYTFKGKNNNSKNTINKNGINIYTNDTAITCDWASNALEVGRSWGGSDPEYYTANVQIYNLMIYDGTMTEYQIKRIAEEESKKYDL